MRTIFKLAVASLRAHPARAMLTSAATLASACMVVWVVSGYDALLRSFDEFSNRALGRYALSVAPIAGGEDAAIPPGAAEALRADPAVADVRPMWLRRAKVKPKAPAGGIGGGPGGFRGGPPGMGGGAGLGAIMGRGPGGGPSGGRGGYGGGPGSLWPEAAIIGTDSPEPPFALLRGRWIDPSNPEAMEAVVGSEAARRFGTDAGDELTVGEGERKLSLRVAGVMDVPTVTGSPGISASRILVPAAGEVFVSPAVAGRIHGAPFRASFLAVSLRPEADLTRFRFGWAPRLSRFAVPLQFQHASDIEEALDEAAATENVRLQSYAAAGVGMLVAFLVVFCTLNIGVAERIRQFAILRAVALTRAQVGMLIAIEGLLLATVGFAGGVGAARLLLWAASTISAGIMRHGAEVGVRSLLLAAGAVYGGALLASIIPAFSAMRVRPVDAMAPRFDRPGRWWGAILTVPVGILLICVNPLLAFVFPPDFEDRVPVFMAAGFASLALGLVLSAPAIVAFVDRLFGPLLARIFGLDPKLLASQITTHLWRTVGAAISMTAGMGLYIAINVWGFTMLEAFVPGRWAPDAMIVFGPPGIPPDAASAFAGIPGVDSGRCLPLVVEQPRLLEDLTRSAERASVTRQDNVVMVGLDPRRGLGGDRPLLKLEWVAGSPDEAIRTMENGRGCIVPDHFLRETGLRMGDTFDLVPPERPEMPVRYTIAGAVRLPGWHWQTKQTGLRPRTHRAAALVFADYRTVAEDFGRRTASHMWLSYSSPGADPERIAGEAGKLYGGLLGREVVVGAASDDAPYVRIVPVEDIRRMMLDAARRWIWLIGRLPLVALVIACIGVLNVMLASVQARRWDIGVLRAIGFGRWAIVRTIVAEGLLIGAVACLLSLGFGIIAGWCGCGFAQYISFFGGLHPSLVVPWSPVVAGLLLVLALSGMAAVWPAVAAGRARPLELLQQGRGSF
ncbi:MAG: ABC transporter permease [Planctomycetota bacterium]|nr:ABC transporter permease [Planctomycetota bacterium]